MLRSADDAEEAVQEALMRAWRMRASCRQPEDPLPWLLQITRNEARRLWEQRRRRAEVLLDPEEDWIGDEPPTERIAEKLDVERALADLGAEDRLLLELRYGEDLTQLEVAERIGIPEGTVKVRLHRLRNRLRDALTMRYDKKQ